MLEITISEYGFIGCDNIDTDDNKFVGVRNLEPSLFEELYNFWLGDKETQKVFTFENKHCLKATSYVGLIQTRNLSIEILPKTYNKNSELEMQRYIFYDMDFKQANIHRGMEYYKMPLRFAELFLRDKSFTSLRGKLGILFQIQILQKRFNWIIYSKTIKALG